MGLFSKENPDLWNGVIHPYYSTLNTQHLPSLQSSFPVHLFQQSLNVPASILYLLQQLSTQLCIPQQVELNRNPATFQTFFEILFQSPSPPLSTFFISTNSITTSLHHHLLWLKTYTAHISLEQLTLSVHVQPEPSPSSTNSTEDMISCNSFHSVSLCGDNNSSLLLPPSLRQLSTFLPLIHHTIQQILTILLFPPYNQQLSHTPLTPQSILLFSDQFQMMHSSSSISNLHHIPYSTLPQSQLDQITTEIFTSGLYNEIIYTFRHFLSPLEISTINSSLFHAYISFIQCFIFIYRFSTPIFMTRLQQYIKDYSKFLIREESSPQLQALQQVYSTLLPYLSPVEFIYNYMQNDQTTLFNQSIQYIGDGTELLSQLVNQFDIYVQTTYSDFIQLPLHFNRQSSLQFPQQYHPQSPPQANSKPLYQTTLAKYFGMPRNVAQYINHDTNRIANEVQKQSKIHSAEHFSHFESDLAHDMMIDLDSNQTSNYNPDSFVSPTKKQRLDLQ